MAINLSLFTAFGHLSIAWSFVRRMVIHDTHTASSCLMKDMITMMFPKRYLYFHKPGSPHDCRKVKPSAPIRHMLCCATQDCMAFREYDCVLLLKAGPISTMKACRHRTIKNCQCTVQVVLCVLWASLPNTVA